MPVTVYRSTDASAPVLSGSVGDLINLLDKCLVAGYGAKAAAGWTKPYTGTNLAAFRQGGGNQFYLDVNDAGPGAGVAREVRVRGYETMSAVGVGTGPFPTVAQQANGVIFRKSNSADAVARVWTLIADDRTMYLFVQPGDTAGQWLLYQFGDFFSFVAGTDGYRTMIMGRIAEVSTGAAPSQEFSDQGAMIGNANGGHYAARNHTGLGGSVQLGKLGDQVKAQSSGTAITYQLAGSGGMPLPNPADGNVWLAPLFLSSFVGTAHMRGRMRGLMHFLHPATSVADQDTVAGAGVYAGHTFLLFKQSANGHVHCIDITAWDAN